MLQDKVNSFRALQLNWNGYGAEPLSDALIVKALQVAKVLENTGFQVFPTGRNSVQFEKQVDGYYVEIEIYEDKDECLTIAPT